MSQLKSPAEFIQDAFAPLVAVLCSSDAEAACRKNNLRFADMLQPFAKMTIDVQFRDASNIAHAVKNFRVRFRDLRENYAHPNAARMYLHAVVDRMCDQETLQSGAAAQKSEIRGSGTLHNADYSNVQVESNTRWFEAYRELALRLNQPSDHEFVRTFVGCLFVVSTACAEPLAAFSNLTSEQYAHQHTAATRYPRWFHSTVLKHFVLLHDVDEAVGNAETLFEDLKMAYGPTNCTLLRINSRSAADVRRGDADQQPNPFSMLMQYDELAAAGLSSSVPPSSSVASFQSTAPSVPSSGAASISSAIKSSKSLSALNRPEDDELGVEDRPLIDQPLGPNAGFDGSSLKHSVSMSLAASANGETSAAPNGTVLRDPLGVDEAASSGYDEASQSQASVLNSYTSGVTMTASSVRAVRYGAFLTPGDIDRLRSFVHELLLHGVLPFLERTLRTLSENVANSKKSVQRSMLQLTKKLFSGSARKPALGAGTPLGAANPSLAGSGTQTSENAISIVYTSDSAELQLRKYADLALALQQYESAFQTYQSLRRDFQNEDAWLHFAGASEMCAVCLFLQQASAHTHTQRQYPMHYMDEAINTYLNVCRNVPYATRAALLSTEILKAKRFYAEAIAHYLRMTAEDSDLRSALFLEQAALCYAAQPRAALRKYAFHLVLAGFRFSKAGLRRHSLRCYDAAWQLLRSRTWLLAEDLIIVTLARHLHALRAPREALDTFKLIFTRSADALARTEAIGNPNQLAQSATQMLAYLAEFLTLYRQYLAELPPNEAFAELELPGLLFNRTKVLLSDDPAVVTALNQSDSDSRRLNEHESLLHGLSFADLDDEELLDELVQLEDALIRDANAKRSPEQLTPTSARARRFGYRVADLRSDTPVDVLAECPLRLLLNFRNALNVRFALHNLRLVCRFESPNQTCPDEGFTADSIDSVVIDATQLQPVELTLRPHRCGTLVAYAVTYELGLPDQPPSSDPQNSAVVSVRQTFARPLTFRVREAACPFTVCLAAPPGSPPVPAGALLRVPLTFVERRGAADMIELEDAPNRVSVRNVKVATNCARLLVADGDPQCFTEPPATVGTVSIRRESQSQAATCCRAGLTARRDSVAVLDVSVGRMQPDNAQLGSILWLRAPDDQPSSRPTRMSVVVYFEHGAHFYTRAFQCSLHAAPALRVEVAVQRSLSSTTACSLFATVAIENRAAITATDDIVLLTQLTTISRRYALAGVLSPSLCRIGAQQTAQFAVRLDRIPSAVNDVTYASVTLADRSDSVAEVNPTCTPSVNFYLLERRAAAAADTHKDFSAIDSRCVDVDFVVFWRTARSAGQSHVFIDRIEPAEVSPTLQNAPLTQIERARELGGPVVFGDERERPIALVDEYALRSVALTRLVRVAFELADRAPRDQPLVRHCFARNRFCIVPLRIHVHSLVTLTVRVRVDACSKRVAYRPTPTTTPTGSPSKAAPGDVTVASDADAIRSSTNVTCVPRNAPLYGAVTVVGSSIFELQLGAATGEDCTATICVRVGVSQAGIYDVAECFEVSACLQRADPTADADGRFITQTYVPNCMLIVENVDK